MPVISRFYGVAIVMYFKDHNPPHIHAKYSGYEGAFDLSGKLIAGSLPTRAEQLVKEWLGRNQDALYSNWLKAELGQPLSYIEPLE